MGLISLTWVFCHNLVKIHLVPIEILSFSCFVLLLVKLLSVLSSGKISFKTHGHVHSSCVQSAMLHASETWPLTMPSLQRLQ